MGGSVPVADQRAKTVARLLVEEVICSHGAPECLLSDRGANLLSDLIAEVCRLMKVKKVNTSGYHPQTDGLVERFHQTLIQMLSLYVEKHGRDWDHYLSYLLYAYHISTQESVHNSPFFLLYGRDPRQPTDETLACPTTLYVVDTDDYKSGLVHGLSDAWKAAAQCIKTAQRRQKTAYDRYAKTLNYRTGDRVIVHMPHESTGKAAKLAWPFFGPLHILNINMEVRLVDKPDEPSIFVSLSRVRPCYEEVSDVSWSGHTPNRKRHSNREATSKPPVQTVNEPYTGPMTRSRTKVSTKD